MCITYATINSPPQKMICGQMFAKIQIYPYPQDSKIIQLPYPRAKAIDQIPALCPTVRGAKTS